MPSGIPIGLLARTMRRTGKRCRGLVEMRGGLGCGIGLKPLADRLGCWEGGIIRRIAVLLGIVKWHWQGYILRFEGTKVGTVSRRRWIIELLCIRLVNFVREGGAGRHLRVG